MTRGPSYLPPRPPPDLPEVEVTAMTTTHARSEGHAAATREAVAVLPLADAAALPGEEVLRRLGTSSSGLSAAEAGRPT